MILGSHFTAKTARTLVSNGNRRYTKIVMINDSTVHLCNVIMILNNVYVHVQYHKFKRNSYEHV